MIVYTGGTFDLLHSGHVALLAACRQLAGPGGRVVVALNRDAFVASYKDRMPVMAYDERATVLAAMRHVDEVVPNAGGTDSRPTIEAVRPDVIAIGADWAERDYHGQLGLTPAWLAERGITLVYVHHQHLDLHSADIRERVAAR